MQADGGAAGPLPVETPGPVRRQRAQVGGQEAEVAQVRRQWGGTEGGRAQGGGEREQAVDQGACEAGAAEENGALWVPL